MNNPLGIVIPWVLPMTIPVFLLLIAGLCKLYFAQRRVLQEKPRVPQLPIDILVPVKGILPNQEEVLSSLLEQLYSSYRVIFIVETEQDPANGTVDRVCKRYQHAEKIISGISNCCGQKNHNLVRGALSIKPHTDIIVFCDSTNSAPPDWLRKFTEPIRDGSSDVVTTFRTFYPDPENIGGLSQTVYGTLILLLAMLVPKPWGGATAIRRSTFDRLEIIEAWSKTVVDDLVLGNLLEKNGVAVRMDPMSTLKSPLKNQSVRGFLNYLDRQILFPKFTNPVIWAGLTILYINFSVATPLAIVSAVLFPFGTAVDVSTGLKSFLFVGALLVLAVTVRKMLAPHISLNRWLKGVICFLFLGAGIVVRSIFRWHIDWHGRTYWCGREGRVLRIGPKRGQSES